MAFLLLIVLQSTSILNAGGHVLEERFVNVSNIITKTPFTTITSCVMSCSANDACSAVGFSEMPVMDRKLECLHLEYVTVGSAESNDFERVIILMNVSENENQRMMIGSDPKFQNCSRFSSKDESNAYTFFAAQPHDIKKDTLIATIKTLKKRHRIQFQLKIDTSTMITWKYYNIIRFSNAVPTKDNNMNFGTRILFVSVRKTDNGMISASIVYWLNGNVDYSGNMYVEHNINPLFFQGWWRIDLSQRFIDEKYKITIKIGSDIVKEFVNTHPQEFHDVRIFAGDIHPAVTGVIKELVVEGFEGLDFNQNDT